MLNTVTEVYTQPCLYLEETFRVLGYVLDAS